MIMEDVQPVLDKLAAFNLLSLGYEYCRTSEINMGLHTVWCVRFENRFLKSALELNFWAPKCEGDRQLDARSKFSLAPVMVSGQKRDSIKMDLWRYAWEHKLPLAEVSFCGEGQALVEFTDKFLVEFTRASQTYLRDFLIDQAWEVQPDPRGM